ncbi:MAG TPA: triose-phosphate isomerase [Candidatus Paceibacterota bacterium]|nr:triose-phosphate isomerase [Candidatus Paceibacterota bacterium]
MSNKKYVIGNWKALPNSQAEVDQILDFLSEHLPSGDTETSIVVCPPFVYLEEVSKILATTSLGTRVELGAQDIALSDEPSQTGEVTGEQLARLGVRYVIIGHSDRRWKLGESDEITNAKLRMALQHNLTPIVCIGERVREGNFGKDIIDQIDATFAGASSDQIQSCVIAYEPVWAISTNPGAKPDTPESAQQSIQIIRDHLKSDIRMLYGGSVNPKNAEAFLGLPNASGVLVGGASVRPEDFLQIIRAAM